MESVLGQMITYSFIDGNVLEVKKQRRALMKAVETNQGLSFRQNGGVVFIPRNKVSSWEQYEETVPDGVCIIPVDVADTESNKGVIVKALLNETKNYLRQEITKLTGQKIKDGNLKELVLDFIKYANKCSIKMDATTNMRGRLKETYEKVKMYEELLNVDMKYIKTNLKAALFYNLH